MTDFFEAAMMRGSVRDYADEALTSGQLGALEALCVECGRRANEELRARAEGTASGSEGGTPERVVISLLTFRDGATRTPGTYGVIRGARHYFAVATDGSDEAKLAAGCAFERIVLEATAMGLGTCWLAATFRGTAFARAAALAPGMELTAVSPVGVASGRRHLLERITRSLVRESSRKPFEALFRGEAGAFRRALEAVRRAPSSVNSQPWRAIVAEDGQAVHFYYAGRSNCVMLDMGIAVCHFTLVCAQDGIEGELGTAPDAPKWDKNAYLCSYFVKQS